MPSRLSLRLFRAATPVAVALSALFLVSSPVLLAGCGGHGAQAQDRADVPETFTGIFDGNWSLPLRGMSGRFTQVVVSDKGVMAGFYTDETRGLAGELTGGAGPNGEFFMDVNFVNNPGVERLHFEGQLLPVAVRTTQTSATGQVQAVDKQGLQGTFRQRVGETDYQGEFLLISRAPGTVVTETGTTGGG